MCGNTCRSEHYLHVQYFKLVFHLLFKSECFLELLHSALCLLFGHKLQIEIKFDFCLHKEVDKHIVRKVLGQLMIFL